ncbi:hypothetical protein ACG7TL_006207 [Trametes sanguinea]
MQASFRYLLSLVAIVAAALSVAQASPMPEPVERRDPYITVADW